MTNVATHQKDDQAREAAAGDPRQKAEAITSQKDTPPGSKYAVPAAPVSNWGSEMPSHPYLSNSRASAVVMKMVDDPIDVAHRSVSSSRTSHRSGTVFSRQPGRVTASDRPA
jgi:hypothetical protein